MVSRLTKLPVGVVADSYWPYLEKPAAPERKRLRNGTAGWKAGICTSVTVPEANGLVVMWPSAEAVPVLSLYGGDGGRHPVRPRLFWQSRSRADLEKFCSAFCFRGYDSSLELLPHQAGIQWIFRWAVPTKITPVTAHRVAAAFFNDAEGGPARAREIAREFEVRLHDARN